MHEPVHILHIEDDQQDAKLVERSFRENSSAGSQLHQVATAEDAIAFLARQPPFETAPEVGLILLDLGLPGMDGATLLRKLKSDPRTRCVPVVVLTGSSSEDVYEASYQAYANAVIRKPDKLEELVELINRLDRFWTQLVAYGRRLPRSGSGAAAGQVRS